MSKAKRRAGSAKWLAAPNVSWARATAASLLWSLVFCLAYRSEVGRTLESRLAQPVNFALRDRIGMTPKLDERIKIYSLDNATFAKLGSWVLSLEQWSKLLTALAAKRPRAIFIDAVFSTNAETPGQDLAKSVREIAAIKDLGVPIVVGSFVMQDEVFYRAPLPIAGTDYSLSAMLGASAGSSIDEQQLPPLVDRRGTFPYGPAAGMREAVAHVGHLMYETGGQMAPFVRLKDDTVLPQMTMFLARDRQIKDGKFVLDGVTMPVDGSGNVLVNLMPASVFYDAHKSLRGVLKVAESGEPLQSVNEGDVVLILPMMYAGHTDFKDTPVGRMPGGFLHAALLNSQLNGQWLKPVAGAEGFIVALAFIGAALAVRCVALTFSVGMLTVMLLVFGLGQYLFAFHGIVVPWLLPMLSFCAAAVTVFAEKTRVGEQKVQALKFALEGSVGQGELTNILKHPERVGLDARERVVTLMFIDVVGFSLLAENMLPRLAFDNLKKMLGLIGDVVHEFGGIIDKTLGDGLLCYFGYRFDQDSSSPDHAEQALLCAIKIQRENLVRNIAAAEKGEPVYPLRVGINTSSCFLGDLGTSSRIDFTVVGNGVNFAKRLEGACEMHSVLMGSTTYDLVKNMAVDSAAFTRRFIRIKHHSELVVSFEYDPFHAEPSLRSKALEAFRKCVNTDRLNQRWLVHDSAKFRIDCETGAGELINYSHTGLSIKLPRLLGKGTRLRVSIDSADGTLKPALAKEGLAVLYGEVRWGYADGSGYVHGLELLNLTEQQSDYLVQRFCDVAGLGVELADQGARSETGRAS